MFGAYAPGALVPGPLRVVEGADEHGSVVSWFKTLCGGGGVLRRHGSGGGGDSDRVRAVRAGTPSGPHAARRRAEPRGVRGSDAEARTRTCTGPSWRACPSGRGSCSTRCATPGSGRRRWWWRAARPSRNSGCRSTPTSPGAVPADEMRRRAGARGRHLSRGGGGEVRDRRRRGTSDGAHRGVIRPNPERRARTPSRTRRTRRRTERPTSFESAPAANHQGLGDATRNDEAEAEAEASSRSLSRRRLACALRSSRRTRGTFTARWSARSAWARTGSPSTSWTGTSSRTSRSARPSSRTYAPRRGRGRFSTATSRARTPRLWSSRWRRRARAG